MLRTTSVMPTLRSAPESRKPPWSTQNPLSSLSAPERP